MTAGSTPGKKLLPGIVAVAFMAVVTCSAASVGDAGLPPHARPEHVGRKIVGQFLATEPDDFNPPGFTGRRIRFGWVFYAVGSLWVNAMEMARTLGDAALEERLVDKFLPFYGEKRDLLAPSYHVDTTVFGAVPYEVYLLTGDRRALEMGASYADRQWEYLSDADIRRMPRSTKDMLAQLFPEEKRADLLRRGYSSQTRLWIDDMYMISFLQTQAYRATGDVKYIDRTAKEMVLYLDELQLKDGPNAGLFYHAPDVPFVWARGDGWMAGALVLVLKNLPQDSPCRPRIMDGYLKMMSALLKLQRQDGLWGQLVDDSESWSETSGSAMFTYAFIEGVKNGWLCAETYGPAARRAWIALCGRVDETGNTRETCVGTAKKNDRRHYLDRPRITGDPHGQAAMLWCVNALLESRPAAVSSSAWRPYLAPAVNFLKFLPQAIETCRDNPSLKFYGTGESGHWAVQCSQQVAAGLAVLSTLPDADLAASGSPCTAAELRDLALALFRYSFRTHITGDLSCTDGNRWGRHWISVLGLERSCEGLDALAPVLTTDDKERIRKILTFESDYRLDEYPIRAAIRGEDNMPESNIWNAGTLFRTAFNYPDLPRRDAYVEKARKMMLNGITNPGDRGEPWFVGPNFTENWSLDHHGYMNVGYSYEAISNLAFLYFNFLNRRQEVPPELFSHARDLWKVCKGFTFPDGRLNRIGGDTRVRYAYCQLFAFQCWAFCAHALGDADAGRFSREYLKTVVREQSLNSDGSFFGRRLKGIRDASWYYYCRIEADAFLAMCCQLKWHRDHAFPAADGPVATPETYTWKDGLHGAAYVKTPRSVRSIVTRAKSGLNWRSHKPTIVVAPTDASDLAEWQSNLVGWIGCQEESNELLANPAGGSVKSLRTRFGKDAGGDTFEQTLLLSVGESRPYGEGQKVRDFGRRALKTVAIGDGATLVVRDRVEIDRAESLEFGFRSLHWLVPNDFANGFRRTFAGRTFRMDCGEAPARDEYVATGERRLTVDDKMSVLAVRGADLTIRRPVASEIAFRPFGNGSHLLPTLRAEEVVMDYRTEPMRPRPGETLYDVIYIVSAAGEKEAAVLSDSLKVEGDRVEFQGVDGLVRAVDMSIK